MEPRFVGSDMIVRTGQWAGDVERMVRSLLVVEAEQQRVAVTTPVLLGSGSAVRVVVHPKPDRKVTVTDDALTWFEAECSGVPHDLFARVARRHARPAGARFDGSALLVLDAPLERTAGAVAGLANLAKEIFDDAVRAFAKHRARDGSVAMVERLRDVFGSKNITPHAEVRGASGHAHEFDALVTRDGRQAVFEHVSAHAASVNAAVTKLFDVQLLEAPPARIAYAEERDKLASASYLPLLSTVAKVVGPHQPRDALESVAFAA